MNTTINKETTFIDLGLKEYQDSWDYQLGLFNSILDVKKKNRDLAEEEPPQQTSNYLIFVEHPHVYTLGKSGNRTNLLVDEQNLKDAQASFFLTSRGGDITYHGPGQIVGYPILDLENFFTDIHKYMRLLEEVVIQTLLHFGIEAGRIPGLTGVWVNSDGNATARKICAFGVKTSRWVTMHGFALNVNTDLSYFDSIVPCGIADKGVTSMERERGQKLVVEDVKAVIKSKFEDLFGMHLS